MPHPLSPATLVKHPRLRKPISKVITEPLEELGASLCGRSELRGPQG